MMLSNGDITIYHLGDDKKTYIRTNIDGVNINSKRNATVTDKGVNVGYTTMIIAKDLYDICCQDKVILSHIEDDIKVFSDLNKYKPLTIVGLQKNNLFNTINIECK